MKHVVMYSGGIGSWATAKRVAEQHGTTDLVLLFADTLMEDEDLYRFLDESAADIGVPVIRVADGRNIWQVFKDVRFLGNSRIAKCSHFLKQDVCRNWLKVNCDLADTRIYLGIDWTEEHRFHRSRELWAPWVAEAPLCEPPFITKDELWASLAAAGIRRPRLYELGFSHNNCGGGCVKAGIAHFLHLLKVMPERYTWWEQEEQELRDYLGKDIAILRDRSKTGKCKPCKGAGFEGSEICDACDGSGKASRPLTLRELRENTGLQVDLFDWGGCGCFSAEDEDAPNEKRRKP